MAAQPTSTNTMTTVSRRPCDPVVAPPDDTCCQVTCLVQPRFFCGQLLTDTDLKAMIDWSRQRFGLARYREGWGVVCGLHLRADPENPSGILLEPGYALDCCGNDILVCANSPIDLTGSLPQAGCDDVGASQAPVSTKTGRTSQQPAATAVLDLMLRYQTQGTLPQTALGRGSCGSDSSCEYSRTLETFTVEARQVPGNLAKATPRQASIQTRQEEYQRALSWILRLMNDLQNTNNPSDQATLLASWLKTHSPQVYPSLEYDLDNMDQESKLPAEYLLKLLLDYRLSLLQCSCFACREDSGVQLGRVYLEKVGDNDPYRITRISNTADYQRRMPDGFVTSCGGIWPGCLETGQLLRETRQMVTLRLRQSGFQENLIQWEKIEYQSQEDLKPYLEILKSDAVVICPDQADPVKVYTTTLDDVEIVIGFTQGYGGASSG
jgi:hypothetical protein